MLKAVLLKGLLLDLLDLLEVTEALGIVVNQIFKNLNKLKITPPHPTPTTLDYLNELTTIHILSRKIFNYFASLQKLQNAAKTSKILT